MLLISFILLFSYLLWSVISTNLNIKSFLSKILPPPFFNLLVLFSYNFLSLILLLSSVSNNLVYFLTIMVLFFIINLIWILFILKVFVFFSIPSYYWFSSFFVSFYSKSLTVLSVLKMTFLNYLLSSFFSNILVTPLLLSFISSFILLKILVLSSLPVYSVFF